MSSKIVKALSQKTTWMGIGMIVNAPLLAFGVPPEIVAGIAGIVMGLAVIFQRQATQKSQDKAEVIQRLSRQVGRLEEVCERREFEQNDHH